MYFHFLTLLQQYERRGQWPRQMLHRECAALQTARSQSMCWISFPTEPD